MNFGYWYYRRYFDTLKINKKGEVVNFSEFNKGSNDKLKNIKIIPKMPQDGFGEGVIQTFKLKTTYPGLVCGIGYHHEINKPKSEKETTDKEDTPEVYNLGMYFDYTSGLPVIPGSSIKGMLCSAIVEWGFLKDKGMDADKVDKFVSTVFKGEGLSIYDRDIFLDAVPVGTPSQLLFGEDYITHHPDPLQNPTPVRFLRVNPGVTYEFRFILKDHAKGPSAKEKLDLFKEIILTFGLGAKTNVGYGQFTE
ncbi:MAG: type III-B CRISPR module RAMP protein Cmr6 [Porphyromonas sp.]|nr:type III-B CRISPR module RAMP protein Cmr6 [Porphyromonas sp.]